MKKLPNRGPDRPEVTEEMISAGMGYLDCRVDFLEAVSVSDLKAVYTAMRLLEPSSHPVERVQ